MFLNFPTGLLFLSLIYFHCSHGQRLEAVLLDTRIAEGGTFAASAMYDGSDMIYLFGGNRGGVPSGLISCLNISASNPVLENIGAMPSIGEYGLIQRDGDGNILYFNARTTPVPLYKFNPRDLSIAEVASIPLQMRYSSAVKYNEKSNKAYIFGGEFGQNRTIFSFNLDTFDNETLGALPCQWNYMASKTVDRKAFIIGQHFGCGSPENSTQSVLKIDLDTMTMTMGPQTFPKISGRPRSIYDGHYLYVIGGHTKNESGWETNGIVQFNPATFEPKFVSVDNFPHGPDSHFQASPGVVYVAKQSRIYLFGGHSVNPTTYYDRIWYIDLSPMYEGPNTGSQGQVSNIFVTTTSLLLFSKLFF